MSYKTSFEGVGNFAVARFLLVRIFKFPVSACCLLPRTEYVIPRTFHARAYTQNHERKMGKRENGFHHPTIQRTLDIRMTFLLTSTNFNPLGGLCIEK